MSVAVGLGRPMPAACPTGLSDSQASLAADVRVLAGEIGPRGTGTDEEAAAAAYVADRLAGLGFSPTHRSLRAVRSQNSFALGIDAVALGAVAANALGGRPGRWAAAALALACAPLLWRTIRLSTNPLRRVTRKVPSGSVLARVPPGRPRSAARLSGDAGPSAADVTADAGPGAAYVAADAGPEATTANTGGQPHRVVVLAHLDTNRCRVAWRSGAVRWLEPLTWLTLGMFVLLGLLFLAGALVGRDEYPWGTNRGLWLASLVPAIYVVATMITLIRDDRTPFSPGAHDNAASVAVALEVAAGLAARPLARTEVWLAFTGAEETDHAGLYALLADHPAEMRGADFLGLEGLGSGELVFLAREGLCDHVAPDPGLLETAGRAAARSPHLGARPAQIIAEDEVCTLRRLGYRALCIAGRDPITGTLPHWHRADDTPDTVSPEFMESAAEFVRAVLDEIDGRARGPCAGVAGSVGTGGQEACARS